MSRQPGQSLAYGHRLRSWTTSDAPVLVLALRDPLVRHYASVLLDDRDTALGAVHDWNGQWQDGTGAAWAITTPGDEVIGQIRFGLFDSGLGTASVGYWLLPEARGRGLATQAVARASGIVFQRLGWHRVELYHAVENTRSCGVARRSGYPLEGVMREAMRYPDDGRRSDEHLHARLVSDPDPD
ncbi:GNAT family N-acetyltransferase [Kineosporia succinea]|uniref:RimJ/RimL family protein N-acetyltransferase n=1 Tax=Kineosporia succinea TaxID=84632 RepID=A0ABT9NZX0_9ACTN|nr:GNAT family N-acetyltransferase [Kineosporia succinea]MDP9825380.1 RimJ/RimL family protein N-acetyltransferase [Kineosporia succinea]